jgi:hypothetical protein
MKRFALGVFALFLVLGAAGVYAEDFNGESSNIACSVSWW